MQDNYKETRAKSKKFVRYADGAELYSMSVSKFMQLAKDAKAPFQQFFWKVSEDLGKRTGQTAGEIWSRNLKEIQKLLFLTKKEQQDLEEFGQLLGRMDMPMQLSAIQFYQEKIMLSLAEAKAAANSRQKLYRYLGALGGAALVLVIM